MSESLKNDPNLSMIENCFLSSCAAIISKSLVAPLERVKILIQYSTNVTSSKLKQTNRFPFSLGRIIYINGLQQFWRGNIATIYRYFPTQALNFTFFAKIRPYSKLKKTDSFLVKLSKNMISGGYSGVMALTIVHSFDVCRNRLATDARKTGKHQYKSFTDTYIKTVKNYGIRGIYGGYSSTFVAVFLYRSIYFGVYETLKPLINKSNDFKISFLIAYFTTLFAGLSTYPIDTVRRRLMHVEKCRGIFKSVSAMVVSYMVKNPGKKITFFGGISVNFIRALAGAGVISLFDQFRYFYIKRFYTDN